MSTQPGHPFVGRRNEYQPKGGDALRLGSEGGYGSYGWQVKLCYPIVTQGPYLSALAMVLPHNKALSPDYSHSPTMLLSGKHSSVHKI